MRTIKFRGKRLDNWEWVYGDSMKTQRSTLVVEEFEDDGFRVSIKTGYIVSPESVGQWTGLVDMDMVEAYEKDVVDVYFRDGEVERAVLIWDANRFKYQLKSSDGSLWGFNDTLRVKIIGNLIDSPELMEVERGSIYDR